MMKRDMIIRELERVIEKERDKTYPTFAINVREMAQDCLDYIKSHGPKVPDEYGLVECGCFAPRVTVCQSKGLVYIACLDIEHAPGCGLTTACYETEEEAVRAWNEAHGYYAEEDGLWDQSPRPWLDKD